MRARGHGLEGRGRARRAASRAARSRGFAILAALATNLGSCAFTGEEVFAGIRDPDGVAPYGDLGQPLFCAQPRLVGPPDGEPRGFCEADDSAEGAGCTRDEDCRNRERCLCGRCGIQYCDSAAQCGTGRTCSFAEHRCHHPCLTLDDCTLEEDQCDRGVCRQRCAASSECQAGEICSTATGYCVAADCGADVDCQNGQHCAIQREPWDLRAPEALADPGPVLFLEVRRGTSPWSIWRAASADGLNFAFEPAAAVLEPAADEAGRVGAPAVLRTAAGYSLYFEFGDGAGIRRATSTDGRGFTRDPATPVLRPDASWEGGRVGAPAAIELPDGTVALFYEGGEGAGLGLATAADGVTFTKQADPVLTPTSVIDPVLWRDVTRIGQPWARLLHDAGGEPVIGLYFSAFGRESAAALEFDQLKQVPPNFSVGFSAAYVRDLVFSPYPMNPVMDRVVEFLTHESEIGPTVVAADGGYLMYYVRADAPGEVFGNIGVAANPPRF
jgi:hypothetical protein